MLGVPFLTGRTCRVPVLKSAFPPRRLTGSAARRPYLYATRAIAASRWAAMGNSTSVSSMPDAHAYSGLTRAE